MAPIVYVAALSYKRPQALPTLLRGLRALDLPEDWEVRFLIVDNDREESARGTVEAAMPEFEGRLAYAVEPEPGIPAARNRALRQGLDGGGTLLCFLDDDETPEPGWLKALIAHWRDTGAVLIGGPLRRTLPECGGSAVQRLFGRSLIARRALAERRAARAARAGRPVPIYTSNWMCALAIVRDHGLWFDTSMRYSGGSDAAFYFATLERGLSGSWCASAIVSEPIEVERLTFGYQYGRSRAQGIVIARLLGKSAAQVCLRQLPRAIAGLGLLLIPLLGVASFSIGLHLVGSAAGHFASLRGRQSALYERAEAAE